MFKRIVLYVLLTLVGKIGWSQASWEQFGQNRVQYRTFEWKYFDSTHFRTFYYDYGKANAIYALNMAEKELDHIVYMMGGRLNKKLNIVLYNNFSHYRQTNLGRKNDELNQANGGKVDVAGDNIVVYFNGDHAHLIRQIRSGIAKVIKDNMLFGDNLKDVVKNAVKMNLPEWYTLGYVSFIAEDWSAEKETQIKNALQAKGRRKLLELADAQPSLFGQSFWHFIAKKYGDNYISNLLYLTRYRKSVSSALEIVLKKKSSIIYQEWEDFFILEPSQVTPSNDSLFAKIPYANIRYRTGAVYHQIKVSPSGREIAYVEKKDGQFKIKIQDVLYQKTYTIIEGGVRALAELADPDYPMICWSPSGNKMAALYQQKNRLNLRIFTTGKRRMEKRSIPPSKIDRITGMCFMADENTLAITGIKKGQSDLYSLTIRNNRLSPITYDLFDDKDPSFVQNETNTGILFLSNRTAPYTNENIKSDAFNPTFNLYLYDPQRGTNLVQLSDVTGSIHYPIQWGPDSFSFLEDKFGLMKRKISKILKTGIGPDSFSVRDALHTPANILSQEFIHKTAKVAEMKHGNKSFVIDLTPFDTLIAQEKRAIERNENFSDSSAEITETNPTSTQATYLTPFNDPTDTSLFLNNLFQNIQSRKSTFSLFTDAPSTMKAKQYKTTFYPDFIQSTLDNTLLFTRYQPLSAEFNNVPLSGFLTSTLTDVMEDYKLTGGARLGLDFRSLDYFLQYADYRRRADWGLLYFHSNTIEPNADIRPYYSPYQVIGKRGMDFIQSNFSYPLDMLKSVRLQLGVRYDRTRFLAQEKYSIEIPNRKQFWLVSHAEYVYDNTINPMLNIWKGSRVKFFFEYQTKLNEDKGHFTEFGYDARNYLTLYKNLILASRLAGGHSLSKTKVLYRLGGVDNTILTQFDRNTQTGAEEYAFQTLSTNLRGYKQGARSGSSYMVLNEEIRLPIHGVLIKRPVKSGLIRNLQAILFSDMGITMKGKYPTAENIINVIRIQEQSSNVAVYLEKSFAWGYGVGLRTRLLGYFLRTDFAWNIGGSKKPLLHLSLATDF